jgi:hypothetical protein
MHGIGKYIHYKTGKIEIGAFEYGKFNIFHSYLKKDLEDY